jgi:4-hydroxybenzoyl-CoA thioesterase
MSYTRTIPVEFNHCDPAGIVFYPRYFEMTNSVVENFFADEAGHSFARMMAEGQGVPTARVETNFHAPSRLGDRLDFTLDVARIGGASITVTLTARCAQELRITADLTLVWVQSGRPAPWPEALRSRLATHLERVAP